MSTRINANGKRVGYNAHATAEYHFLLQAFQNEMSDIRKHLIKEAERERDDYCKQLQDARLELTHLKVSGKIGVDAEQLPGSPAEGAPQSGHAHAQGSCGDDGRIRSGALLP